MPTTQGQGNPDWNRDETILALELYYILGGPAGPDDPGIVALSMELQRAPYHADAKRNARFRNPAGVALKTQNLHTAFGKGSLRVTKKN